MRIESAMGSDSSDQITGNGLVNTLVGLTGDDLLDGRGANDRLDGGAGMDLLVGGDGNDVLMGGALGDTLDGGLGIDTACYADASNNLSITLATGAKGMDQGDGDTFVSIENVIGSRNGDAVHGNGVANRIEGREGGDRLMGGGGDDRLFGDFDPGSAVAPGVTSFDPTVTIGDQAEIEDESEYAESNYLYGQGGNDILVGGDEYDDLYGGAGNDQLDGGGGSNNLYGGAGNDIYIVGGSDDRVSERAGEGSDRVIASENHYLYDNLESLVLTGTAAIGSGNGLANSILGNTAANRLYGGDGEDRLNGGGGDDRLSGGDDADSLTGGTGRDRFRFDSGIDGTDNIDAIEDFVAADDTILLDRAIFDAIAADGRLAASAFRAGTEATDASDRIVYHQATGRIFYDADGSGGSAVAVLFATVDVGTILTSADFVAVSAPNLGQDG
jgi:Ca2+-binding RTX toxin-like protein